MYNGSFSLSVSDQLRVKMNPFEASIIRGPFTGLSFPGGEWLQALVSSRY